MKIHNILIDDLIIADLESSQREDVLREMVSFLKKRNRIVKDKELYEKLLQRERLGSTAIGEGVAIPHCKMKEVKNPLVLLAVSKKGANFYSLDGKPSKVFFLVVSSPDSPSLNLQILAAIAHLVRKSKLLVKKILEAGSISRVKDVIQEEEEKINE
ncbi:MAG: PTS sugar transporter subunit IIA [Candidatus Aminicenantes bacterium]